MAGAPQQLEWADESALIAELFLPLTDARPGACDLKDDAAWFSPPPGHDLVVSTDGLIEGVHFLASASASDVGWKALAVNVSDIVAKGAKPLLYLMNIALPEDRPSSEAAAWLRGFVAGLAQAQAAFGCALTGGDTDRTPGPLSVTITAIGSLPAGSMMPRNGARPGDVICVCGPIGDAHLGLRLERDPGLREAWCLSTPEADHLRSQFNRPVPPVRLAGAIAKHASAAMDVSDGLIGDLEKLLSASGCAAEISSEKIPISAPAGRVLAAQGASISNLLTGGEDYTILAAVPEPRLAALMSDAAGAGHQVTAIGRTAEGSGLIVRDGNGHIMQFEQPGWDHLSSGS